MGVSSMIKCMFFILNLLILFNLLSRNFFYFQNRKDMSVLELMSSWCGVSMFIQPVGNPTITYA